MIAISKHSTKTEISEQISRSLMKGGKANNSVYRLMFFFKLIDY
jgi:hypothetical protein